jgi:hypothetical protein
MFAKKKLITFEKYDMRIINQIINQKGWHLKK